MNKKLLFYIILIIVILILVFFSQQAVSGRFGKNLISDATDYLGAYLAKGTNMIIPNIYSKLEEGVQGGGEVIQNLVEQGKENISETQKNIENYFSGIKDAVAGKNNTNCNTTVEK